MDRVLKASILGSTGYMGRQHEEAYREMGVEIVDWEDADIISIATPDQFHGEQTIEALQHGKHVFCEKPLCRTLEELNDIKLHTDQHVGQNYPLRHKVLGISLEDCGTLQRIEATYTWGRNHKLFTTWRKDDPQYSLILGGLIHMVDLVYFMTDIEMHLCGACWAGHPADIVYATCFMPSGVACFILDGSPGDHGHLHEMFVSGDRNVFMFRNEAPTDKKACIYDFVTRIRDKKPPQNDFRAVELCLQIENFVATSQSR